jgi:hypothetical protein
MNAIRAAALPGTNVMIQGVLKKFGKKTEESEHNERYAQSKINTIRIERF